MLKYVFAFLFISRTVLCQISFVESSREYNLSFSYGFSNLGGGVSFVDFNDDGLDDITYSSANGSAFYFFRNNGKSYNRINPGIYDQFETKQVLWVDYDNDGDKDFFATSITGPNKLYKHEGNFTFKDVTNESGLFADNLYSSGASFGDIDNDGDLDLFITNRDIITKNQRNYLYKNVNGDFVDITESAGISVDNNLSFCSAFFDYNNDGLQDLYVANDRYSTTNELYKNNGDMTFTDVSKISGAGISIDAMSTTIGDYNQDGWADIYITNTNEGNYHLRNNGDGTFTNVAEELGTKFNSFAWGSVFLDADNDADVDLFVSGSEDGTTGVLSSIFYENINGSYIIPSALDYINDSRISYANAIGDADNDGYPEIIVMNNLENNSFWKNATLNNNNWLKVKLEGTISNKDGIGSVIEISVNGDKQYNYVLCGEGYLGQNSLTEFFGLKNSNLVDYIKVKWPSGIEEVVENIAVNQTIKILENEGVITGFNRENNSLYFSVYPNPSIDGVFNVSTNKTNSTLEVYNSMGTMILSKSHFNGIITINLLEYPSGMYMFTLASDKDKIARKLLKK